MPIETFQTGSTYQPEDRGTPTHEQGSDTLVNYSEQEEYLGRDAILVAAEVFGSDLSRPGVFFTEAGSDLDVPFRVECHGDGHIATFNLRRSDVYGGHPAALRGLDGCVVSADAARLMTTA